jgi:tetratricopeptide (TPR) repeat protein
MQIASVIGDYGGALYRKGESIRESQRLPVTYRAAASFYRFADESTSEARDLAVADLERALDVEPDNADLLAMLGSCHLVGAMQGMTPQREAAMQVAGALAEKAIRIDAQLPRALIVLALLSVARGNPENALTLVHQALESGPRRPSTLFSAGVILEVCGEWDTGVGLHRELAALNPSQAGRHHLYLTLDRLMADDEASALVEANLIAHPMSAWAPLLRGLALAGLGYEESSARELALAESAHPGFLSERGFESPQFWDIAPVARDMLRNRYAAIPAPLLPLRARRT